LPGAHSSDDRHGRAERACVASILCACSRRWRGLRSRHSGSGASSIATAHLYAHAAPTGPRLSAQPALPIRRLLRGDRLEGERLTLWPQRHTVRQRNLRAALPAAALRPRHPLPTAPAVYAKPSHRPITKDLQTGREEKRRQDKTRQDKTSRPTAPSLSLSPSVPLSLSVSLCLSRSLSRSSPVNYPSYPPAWTLSHQPFTSPSPPSSTANRRTEPMDNRLAQDSIHRRGPPRTSIISILVCEKTQCLGAVRGVCCIDQ
jgi:hypothetical protein